MRAEKMRTTLDTGTEAISKIKRKLAGALKIILGRIFVYEELVVLETSSQTRSKPVSNRAKIYVRLASSSDISKLDRFEKFADGKARERIDSGHLCFIAEENEKIVNYAWVCFREGYVDEIERRIRISPDSAYGYDEYTVPEYRGMGILPTVLTSESDYLFQNGIRKIYELVRSNNFPSLRSHKKIGSRKVGKIVLFRLFKSRRYRCKGETSKDYEKLREMFSL